MKALGIVRKIDNLGRIVIPKEVRDNHGWKSGQAMEMFMTEDGLVMKDYRAEEEKENALNILKRTLRVAKLEQFHGMAANIEEVIQYLENK